MIDDEVPKAFSSFGKAVGCYRGWACKVCVSSCTRACSCSRCWCCCLFEMFQMERAGLHHWDHQRNHRHCCHMPHTQPPTALRVVFLRRPRHTQTTTYFVMTLERQCPQEWVMNWRAEPDPNKNIRGA